MGILTAVKTKEEITREEFLEMRNMVVALSSQVNINSRANTQALHEVATQLKGIQSILHTMANGTHIKEQPTVRDGLKPTATSSTTTEAISAAKRLPGRPPGTTKPKALFNMSEFVELSAANMGTSEMNIQDIISRCKGCDVGYILDSDDRKNFTAEYKLRGIEVDRADFFNGIERNIIGKE